MAETMKRPNLFIIGAPKCGTTSLANWLGGHPACHLPERKEPHFFTVYDRPLLTREQYEALYADAAVSCQVLIDASTDNYESGDSIRRILEYNPDARFVMMLRDPVEMAYSLYQEHRKQGLLSDESFAVAWANQDKRRNATRGRLGADPRLFLYRDRCLLGTHLKNIAGLIPKDRLHLVFFEDLKRDPANCYAQVLTFCGLPDDGRADFSAYNMGRETRYPKLNAQLTKLGNFRAALGIKGGLGIATKLRSKMIFNDERKPLPDTLRTQLSAVFADDIRLLAEVTGRDLSHWGGRKAA